MSEVGQDVEANGATARGARLAARLTRRLPALARRTVDQLTTEIPVYGVLPAEEVDGEILDITLQNLRLFTRMLKEHRHPTESELSAITTSAERRAEERVPLADVLAAYHIGGRLGWLELIEIAEPDEQAALHAAGEIMLRYMQSVTSAVSTAYVEVRQRIHSDERVARQQLTAALMSGQPTAALIERAGIGLAPAYLALAIVLAETEESGDSRPEVGPVVGERRRALLVQGELDGLAGGHVLAALDGHGGIALLPVALDNEEATRAAVASLVDNLAHAVGAPAYIGAGRLTAPPGLPEEIALAQKLVELARRSGRPPGLYGLEDLLVEYQLTRPGPAREALARRLEEIAHQPQLVETLRAYLEGARRRQQAAQSLHIHPNTLDYRLGRIAELTGLDPAKPADSMVLLAALTIRAGASGQ